MNPTSQEQEVIKDYDLMTEDPIRYLSLEAKEKFQQILTIANQVVDMMEGNRSQWLVKHISIIANQYTIYEFRFLLDIGSSAELETFMVYGSIPSYTPVWRINLQYDEDKWKLVKE